MDKLCWEDISPGDEFWGDFVDVDPDEMLAYARRNDPLPVHLDEAAAEASMFGGLIASGGFTVTLWYRSCIPITNQVALLSGFEWHIKLLLPVRPNDRLRTRITILSKRPSSKPGRGYALVIEEVFNQDETLVFSCEGTWMLATRS